MQDLKFKPRPSHKKKKKILHNGSFRIKLSKKTELIGRFTRKILVIEI